MEAVDVVVVGSGSAGCTVAARLARATGRSVVLVEAGPDLRSDPPPTMHDGWRTYREQDWGLTGEWDGDREPEPLYRGRVIGGTSWVTRFALRGAPADYQEWVRLGNENWSYEEVLPYFIRLENDLEFGDRPWHGRNGPLPITRYPEIPASEFETALFASCAASGFALVEDLNAPDAIGAGRMPRSGRDERRVTGVDLYLPSRAAEPANLRVRADSEVANVEIHGGRATGVRLLDGTVLPADWVVLCAGTYGSPVILLRSGIGPGDHLREMAVPVQADLPGVGANLADHPGAEVDPGLRGDRRTPRLFWLATFHSSYAEPGDPPDLALWAYEPFGDPAQATVDAVLLTPRSRGSVRLRSDDPRDPPRIRLPGVRDQADVRRLLEGLERAEAVVSHREIRHLCQAPAAELPAAPEERWAWLRQHVEQFPHTVGTCAMGPSADGGAVVDPFGRVHGVDNLSVADASVIPTSTSGFPHLISMVVAERIAENVDAALGS